MGLALLSCSDSEAEKTCAETGTCQISLQEGDEQSAQVRTLLRDELSVLVLDENLLPAPGINVEWSVVEGNGTVDPEVSATGPDGIATTQVTIGTVSGGDHAYEATVQGVPGQVVRFTAAARPGRAEVQEKVSGDNQTAGAGAPLLMPLRVRITDEFGNGVPEVLVDWEAVSSNPAERSMITTPTPTDSEGFAQTNVILGPKPGPALFIGRGQGVGGNPIDFNATIVPGPPSVLVKVSGDNQAGLPNESLANPLVVQITDRFDNPVEGSTVAFSIQGMDTGATIDPMTGVTDAMGRTSANASLGSEPGEFRFTAQAGNLNGSPQTFVATAFPPICSPTNWCWLSPLPQGNTMNAAYAASESIVWVVGEGGSALRWNAVAWESVPVPTNLDLSGVHGAGPSAVFAVGQGGFVAHHDGSAWTIRSDLVGDTDLAGIWMASDTDGWTVGEGGFIARWNGMVWQQVQAPTTESLRAVFGLGENDVYAVGERGTVLRFDGSDWTSIVEDPASQLNNTDLNGVWGAASDEMWVVGDGDSIFRWDGTDWFAVAGTSSQILNGIWGRGANEIYAFGNGGRVRRYNGNRWSLQTTGTVSALYGASAIGEATLVVGEDGTSIRNASGNFRPEAERRNRAIQAVWGASPDEAWAVGASGSILQWDGSVWSEVERVVTANLVAVTGTAADDIWAVGQAGTVLHYDGARWRGVVNPANAELLAVWPLSATDVFAVGREGTIIRYDGISWSLMDPPADPDSGDPLLEDLRGVYGASANEVWAVGGSGVILRFDGTTWSVVPQLDQNGVPFESFLQGIRGTSRNDVYAYGTDGAIIRFDGTSWGFTSTFSTSTIFSVHLFDRDNAYAVGENGTILTRTSTRTWRPEASGTQNILFGVWGASTADIWAVGESSTILRNKVVVP